MIYGIAEKEEYYNNPVNKINLLNIMRNRELCSMDMKNETPPYRHIYLINANYIPLVYKDLKIFTDRNIYITSARFGFLPNRFLGSYGGKWVLISNEEFNRIAKETILSYDLLLDFDKPKSPSLWGLFEGEYNKVKACLELSKCKFIANESKTGYHITIPYEVIKLPLEFNKISENETGEVLIYYCELVKKIKKAFKLEFLCLANAGVFNRLQLCPYTICNNEKIIIAKTYNTESTEKEFKDFYNQYLKGVEI